MFGSQSKSCTLWIQQTTKKLNKIVINKIKKLKDGRKKMIMNKTFNLNCCKTILYFEWNANRFPDDGHVNWNKNWNAMSGNKWRS